jgi:ATP-dependent helicase Lhr and Lhr-like helicase
VLPARVRQYNPADLEEVCLSGMVAWGRHVPNGDSHDVDDAVPVTQAKRRQSVARNTPIGFVLRDDLPLLLTRPRDSKEAIPGLSSAAAEVAGYLETRGASFLPEIVKGTGRMLSEVEEALGEQVSHGLVSGDGVAGDEQRVIRRRDATATPHISPRRASSVTKSRETTPSAA